MQTEQVSVPQIDGVHVTSDDDCDEGEQAEVIEIESLDEPEVVVRPLDARSPDKGKSQ